MTLGCKVNQYESNQIARQYLEKGYEVVRSFVPDADIYVVNTCAVTSHAEKKSRNTVTRCKKCGETIVCGCAEVIADGGTVSDLLAKRFGGAGNATQPRKRAFIKVQDGCNNFCSYCIVPYLRGRSTSRPIDDVVAEVREAGKAVVITGIDLSSYGLDIGTDLGGLCVAVDKCGFPFELSSIEVGVILCRAGGEDFLATLKACGNFIPKFHVPLQSGSDKVLRDMNRKYTSAEYLQAVARIREAFPCAVISADVIVGYPTETAEDLAATNEVIKKANFAKVHTFPYSDRGLLRFKKLGS
jgi:threonylcarbamoyladenosine tRNA methylthiotransferase MtaB